jgi:5'-deoxynucleotidase YfbR-like HD superfamily hydrolase
MAIKTEVSALLKDLPEVMIQKLKHIPRTGKACRIDAYRLNLPKRSLYDHIISLADQAEIFAKHANVKIDAQKLAQCICFHDLPEIILGDVPEFTKESLYKIPSLQDKEAAAKLIAKNLSPELRKKFIEINKLLQQNTELIRFFAMIDEIDPIIAIWRYLYLFKSSINTEKFLEAMSDFFTNPDVIKMCFVKEIADLIKFLQNKNHAREYREKGLAIFEKGYNGAFSIDEIKALIEKRKMHVVQL